MTLSELLLSSENRAQLIRDCVQLIEFQVAQQSGITGMSIKTVFKLAQKIKAGIMDDLVAMLLPSFSQALEPFYTKFQESGVSDFKTYLQENTSDVVQALLSVTDQKAQVAKNTVLQSGYKKLRGLAEKQVTDAFPRVAELLGRYVQKNP